MTKAEAYWILDELRKECLSELYGEACGIAQECIEFADLMQERTQTKTNADRIRTMSDEELARFIANKIVNIENHKMIEQGHTPTATQLSALGNTCYCTLMQWLKQPAEGGQK